MWQYTFTNNNIWTRTHHHHPTTKNEYLVSVSYWEVNIPNRKSNLFSSISFVYPLIFVFPSLECTSDKQFHFLLGQRRWLLYVFIGQLSALMHFGRFYHFLNKEKSGATKRNDKIKNTYLLVIFTRHTTLHKLIFFYWLFWQRSVIERIF